MARYYRNRPSTIADRSAGNDVTAPTEAPTLSEFDKHRETLLSDDAEEGWASELRRYLGTMQRDVKKDTDIVEWWQVRNSNNEARYLLIKISIEPCSALSDTCAYRA
jgi:hypothetical protein